MKARDILTRMSALPPQWANILAWYRGDIADGRLIAYRPPQVSSTPQVKGSLFSVAVPEDVPYTGLLTTDVITVGGGTAPTCAVDGTLSMTANFWDMRVHRSGVLWAYWPGINVGQTTELDASGNGHHLTALTTTTITERLDGSGTNYANEVGFSKRENLIVYSEPISAAQVSIPQGVTYEAASGNFTTLCSRVMRFPPESAGACYVWQSASNSVEYQELSFFIEMADGSVPVLNQVPASASIVCIINGSYTGITIRSCVNVIGNIYRVVASRESSGASGYSGPHRYTTGSSAKECVVSGLSLQRTTIDRVYCKTSGAAIQAAFRLPYGYPSVNAALQPKIPILACEGDSRTNETSPSTTFWPQYVVAKLGWTDARIHNFAVGGGTVAGMASAYATEAHVVAPSTDEVGYFVIYAAANDLGPGVLATGASVYENLKLIWAAARTDGYVVVASTEAGSSGWTEAINAQKVILNGLIRSDPSLYDLLLEPDTHPQLSATANTLYYLDGTHLTDLGSSLFAEMVAAAISPTYVQQYYQTQFPGPLNVSATITSGDTFPAVTIKAPLGPKFQSIAGWAGEAAVDLSTLSATARTRIGPRGMLIYGVDLSAADQARADGYLGA